LIAQARSPWRHEEVWPERLQRDQDLLRERIGQETDDVRDVPEHARRNGWIDFLVVYGKAAREGFGSRNGLC
jgi:hypothetical protein